MSDGSSGSAYCGAAGAGAAVGAPCDVAAVALASRPATAERTTPMPMFTAARPYQFHIELTDKCNAGCPMCPRTDAMNFCRPDPARVSNVELTLADFESHFTDGFCGRTDEVILGGAFGDPVAASQSLEIVEHLTARGVRVALSSNGGLRRPDWWRRLGEAMRRSDSRLELHLDGLADTNHLYRVNTRWERIVENARAYIASGARAEWHFIIFRHNQHQIEAAHRLSREMGFASFTLIDTVRFSGGDRYPYRLPNGEERVLELPSVRAAQFAAGAGASAPESAIRQASRDDGIDCKSAAQNRAYISARGMVSACCWIAGSGEEAALLRGNGLSSERYDLRRRPLEEILADEPFAGLYDRAWRRGSLATCDHKCGRKLRNRRVRL